MATLPVKKDTEQQVAKGAETTSDVHYVSPAVDVFETENELVMVLDMPGVSRDKIKVHIDKGVITITGDAGIPQGGDFRYVEFRPNHYKRAFELSPEVDQERIRADYKQGVLTILMPKHQKVQAKEITVNVK